MRVAICSLIVAMIALAPAGPQARAAGIDAGKDCHVILSCNFRRGASVRGCLSSYSCRQCQFVSHSVVSVDGLRRKEWHSVCEWGAS